MFSLNKTIKFVSAFIGISLLAFGLSRINTVGAQSSSTSPSGTFACLINANYSGYINKTSKSSDAQAVNALLVFTFSSTVPNTGSMVAA